MGISRLKLCRRVASTRAWKACIKSTRAIWWSLALHRGQEDYLPNYHVLLVDQDRMTDLVTGTDFGTSDGTFKAIQRGDEVHFDQGFQKRQKKSAIYRNGTITVDIRSLASRLPKNECAAILNMAATCVRLTECNEGGIFDNFAMAGQRYFKSLEEMPVFTTENFYSVCTTVCTTKSYVAKQARSVLCGY
jgi:hypothetical protein